jgi:hypothetical protein
MEGRDREAPMSILSDASDDLVQRHGIDLETAQRMAADAYDRRDKVSDQMWRMNQPDWTARATITRQGLR